ncbi:MULTISPECIES: hypothetical protein [unclassified Paraburkholderia]|uniref:hypothetical protein n=1 Tax=unclassified Paraburkholderia TaxID=2615204 RepID=UPI0020B7605B|nr:MULTISPECIES: hypothetical protein [unclassified Paraburkholderia]MCP3718300.1 hypothetical protein [Paraburkholderia sp. CNPSo 3281]MCX5544353.1 hypothetical protein [Paraburkholderia sp. CNPSo 3076]
METRLDTFNGWQMKATVASRLTPAGEARYFVVEPPTYMESSAGVPKMPENTRCIEGSFDDPDDAFRAAFDACKRAIEHAESARNV